MIKAGISKWGSFKILSGGFESLNFLCFLLEGEANQVERLERSESLRNTGRFQGQLDLSREGMRHVVPNGESFSMGV